MPKRKKYLPREVWVAGISLKGLWPTATIKKRMDDIVERINQVLVYEPDIICLPETVNLSWVNEEKLLSEVAEDEINGGPVAELLASIARNNNCYITCPVVTNKGGQFYNSSILLDRQGKPAGTFHKIHPTSTEIVPGKYFKGGGITPGKINANTMDTDFGVVGLQICADADWADGWQALKRNGAELVCFSSQGPYTNTIRNRAWLNQYFIVTATGEDAQIADITGDPIAVDNPMNRWVCAPVNLEKVMIQAMENTEVLKQIQKKYVNKLLITVYYDENWATIESRDPEISVRNVLKEYSLRTFSEQMSDTEKLVTSLHSSKP